MGVRANDRIRSSRKTFGSVSAALAVLFHVNIAFAGELDPRAQQVLDAALKAHGGSGAWDRIETLSIVAKGQIDQSGEVQGLHPDKPCLRTYEEKLFYQAPTLSVARAIHAPRNDFSLRWRQTILRDEERTFVDFVSRSARRSVDPSAPAERRGMLRRIPQFTLQEARNNAGSLRWRGGDEVNGKTQDVIVYTMDTGDELAISVDHETHTVTRYEMNLDFPTLGDTVLEWIFPGHQPVEPLGLFPTGYTVKVGGRTYLEMTYDKVEVNEILPSEAFGPPPDIELPPPPEPRQKSTPPSPQVESIADGVFFVTHLGGFNTMFVELADFVLAVESPANYPWLETIPPANMASSSSLGEKYLEIIKSTVPDKPIKYLALTHHHSDHVGGAPAFMAEGVTVLIPLDYFPPVGRTIIMRHFADWLREKQISPKRIYGVHGPWYGTAEHLSKILAESTQPKEEDALTKLTNIESSYPFWSPDGSRIVFQSNRNDDNSEIYVINSDGTGITRLTHHAAEDLTPVWSPDGSKIAFQSDRDGNRDIYLMNPDGSGQVNLTRHPAEDSHPKFTSDGTHIIFDSDRQDPDKNYEIYKMKRDGSEVRRLTEYDDWDTYASLSPDGTKLLWRRVVPTGGNTQSGRNSEIFLRDRDGAKDVNLSNHSAFDGWPSFSPDGTKIAFASDRDEPGIWHIYLMNVDGSRVVRVTPEDPEGGYFTKPIFSFDGSKIVCTRTKEGDVAIFTIDVTKLDLGN